MMIKNVQVPSCSVRWLSDVQSLHFVYL